MQAQEDQIARARACLADAERAENSLETRIEAAFQAAVFLDVAAKQDSIFQEYLASKYDEPLEHYELLEYYAHAHTLAKERVSKTGQS